MKESGIERWNRTWEEVEKDLESERLIESRELYCRKESSRAKDFGMMSTAAIVSIITRERYIREGIRQRARDGERQKVG